MPIARVLPVLVADAMMACDASATGWGGWVGVGREVDVYANNFLANLREKAPPGVSLSAVNRAAHSGITVAGASQWNRLEGARPGGSSMRCA